MICRLNMIPSEVLVMPVDLVTSGTKPRTSFIVSWTLPCDHVLVGSLHVWGATLLSKIIVLHLNFAWTSSIRVNRAFQRSQFLRTHPTHLPITRLRHRIFRNIQAHIQRLRQHFFHRWAVFFIYVGQVIRASVFCWVENLNRYAGGWHRQRLFLLFDLSRGPFADIVWHRLAGMSSIGVPFDTVKLHFDTAISANYPLFRIYIVVLHLYIFKHFYSM